MGGHATWRLAMVYPSRFAAIAPVSGAGNPQHGAELLRRLPIRIIHGENDTVVPVELARRMVRALEQVGGNVKSTIYPDRGHDAFIPAYDDPELYQWLLKHRKR
jgi:predicted peptidase